MVWWAICSRWCPSSRVSYLGASTNTQDLNVTETQSPIVDRLRLYSSGSAYRYWCLSSKFPVLNEDGRAIGLIGISRDVRQAKFSTGTDLAVVAEFGHAGVREFDSHYKESRIAHFRKKVSMVLDHEVDTAYPSRWIGKVMVQTKERPYLRGPCG